jgi:tetratricopeptide (TPR) repeat protein
MYRAAVGEAEETIRLSERSPSSLSLLASACAKAGDQKRSLKIVQELETQIRQRGGGNEVALARTYAALGENEKALALLEEAYKNRRPGLAFVTTTPQFDSLSSDPRFGDLLQRVGLRKGSAQSVIEPPVGGSK